MYINPEIYISAHLLLAAVLGSLLGLQRERWGKPAGPRTHALVAVGAALFTALSLHAFGAGNNGYVAAQIVTGIGFLCAGIIFRHEDRVEGLTTAAGLWATAAMGMAVGAGYFWLAILATVLMLVLFMIDDKKFKKNNDQQP